MTGNLFLKNDGRMHFVIADADGNARMWLFKDKGGDGVCINNGYDGGGDFILRKDGGLTLGSGAQIAPNGDILGGAWGNVWLTSWITNQLNSRATIGWVNQNFPSSMRWGGISSTATVNSSSVDVPAGSAVVGVTMDVWGSRGTHVTHIRHRPFLKLINGAWLVIDTW
ncbi:hypothetical protein FVC29_03115 [Salmonella enterica]|nr:hypothetical protein [Salmonella enterica]EJB4183857.1 hypothetical protein [Salmonella enterica]